MPDFAFRISLSWNDCSVATLAYLSDLSEKLIIYEHEADEEVARTHIHGLIMGCSRSDDTLRNNLFKIKYTKNYELKSTYVIKKNGIKTTVPVDDRYITYMSKGKLDPKYCKGWTKEEVEEYKAMWIDYDEVKKKEKEKDSTKAITRYELIKECAEEYKKQELFRYTGEHNMCHLTGRALVVDGLQHVEEFNQSLGCEVVIAKCIEHKQTMGFYKIVDIVDNVHMISFPQRYHARLHGYFLQRDKKIFA